MAYLPIFSFSLIRLERCNTAVPVTTGPISNGSTTKRRTRRGDVPAVGGKMDSGEPGKTSRAFKLFHHRNLDACTPPAPCDPAPLLLRPAQARLNFGSGPAHPAHPADRTVAEPRSIPL